MAIHIIKIITVTMQHKNQQSQLGFDNYVMSEYTTCFGLQGHRHIVVFIKTLNNLFTTKKIHE